MNGKILVLDDEPGILESYRIILTPPPPRLNLYSSRSQNPQPSLSPVSSFQFEVTFCTSGEEAIEQIKFALKDNRPFVGGFFDVKLGGGMDGLECIREVRQLDPEFFCVTVTAYQDRNIDEITKLFGESFADRWDFISKPFTANEILQKARNLVFGWDRRKKEREYLSQIKSQQSLLIRQERLAAMGGLARGLGHEFGNILLGIIGRAELAKEKKDPREMEEALHVILRAAERASHLVKNLQALVQTESKRTIGSISGPIEDSLELMKYELLKSKVTVDKTIEANLPDILLNQVEMSQVFLNLFLNAIHAMEQKGGRLLVHAFTEKDGIGITIEDTGIGIPPENLASIFEPLFTTKGEKGSGLGLSVSKKIIENHQGTIHVQNAIPTGAQFKIWLPRNEAA